MYWIRRQITFWRYYARVRPYRMLGLIAVVLVGGITWGSIAGHYLRPLVYPPAASPSASPVFTPSPTPKPSRTHHHTLPAAPEPTYRPEPRPSTPRPVRTSHSPSPTPSHTTKRPCGLLPKCQSSSPTTEPSTGTASPDSQEKL